MPRPVEVIEGVGWAGCISVLVSESGVGKTFVLLDISAAVSSGVAWHGREVQQGSVAYLSYEGDALGLRLGALREKVNTTPPGSGRTGDSLRLEVDAVS